MENKNLKNGIYYATIGSLWWGLLGTYFFQYISYAGTVEVVVHRSLWTCIILFLTTIYFKKWPHFKKIFFNKKNLFILIIIVILSSIFLLFNFESFPWVGIFVAIFWSVYNLLRKKIDVDTDIGLFIESLFALPLALVFLYFIFQNNFNNFSTNEPLSIFLLFLAGPMTVIPLFFYIKGLEKAGLGTSGMIFFITPTSQFLLCLLYTSPSPRDRG